ncbi:MAG: hypothetical protein K2X11_15695, partial [Acetobacteraceae bacterium]|nr:hypothetical protein [Acetobacteraceae bacterium]
WLTALALLAGAPGLARLVAYEADLPRAAHLAGNIADHAGERGQAVADALPPLGQLGLDRIDLLRTEDAARIMADAPALTAGGTLVAATLDLRRELVPGRPHPAETLAAWCAAYGGLVTFDRRGAPLPAADASGLAVALEAALDSPERRVEVFLGPAGWVERYAG